MSEGTTADAEVLIVIVNYRSAQLTLDSVRSVQVERERLPRLRMVVVENDSGEAELLRRTLSAVEFRDWVSVIESGHNGGFAAGCNVGIRSAEENGFFAEFILLLNPDTRIHQDAVRILCDFLLTNPQVGIVGSGLDLADGTNWPIAFRFPSILSEIERGLNIGVVSRLLRRHAVAQQMGNEPAQIDWVPGASMMFRREVIEQVGGLDEGFFLYYEETDFCHRARKAGWTCWYVPASRVLHIAGQSTGLTAHDRKPERVPDYWFESRRRYFLKHHGRFYTAIADVAFLAASFVGRLKRLLQRKGQWSPPRFLRDFLRHSVTWRRNRMVSPEKIYRPKPMNKTERLTGAAKPLSPATYGQHLDADRGPRVG